MYTFDQPLFLKASEIVAAAKSDTDILKIIVGLGGFHLLMSYMGSVGHIMEDSGLESLWGTVYGSNTVQSMMNGHSYARCIRAYALTSSAICNVLTSENVNLRETITSFQENHTKIVARQINTNDVLNDPEVVEACTKIGTCLASIAASSRTAKLWINLLKCLDLIFKFVFAERTSNWQMQVATIVEMLPFSTLQAIFLTQKVRICMSNK